MNVYYLGSALNISSLYMVAGAGAIISIKSGEFNLGGEGQIYAGGFICAILLSGLSKLPPFLALSAAFIAAFVISGALTCFSIILKHLRNADFLFTTYIVSAAIIPFIDGLITGPCRSKTDNLLATNFIPQNFRIPGILKPSPLNLSFIAALLICLLFFYLINNTAYGRKICIFGISPDFAKYAAYNCKSLSYSSAFISGGMHGLCGALAISGTYYTCHSGFYSSMGWNAFSAALIAGGNPLLLIPSSLFMGFINTYTNKYTLYHNYGFDLAGIVQAVILLMISFPLRGKKNDS